MVAMRLVHKCGSGELAGKPRPEQRLDASGNYGVQTELKLESSKSIADPLRGRKPLKTVAWSLRRADRNRPKLRPRVRPKRHLTYHNGCRRTPLERAISDQGPGRRSFL